ncbi:MAG TPA: hypothetical protein PLQ93_08155 [Bacteroidia bacterium]|nr:hypothetical protein [Bacteroidia bacterium]
MKHQSNQPRFDLLQWMLFCSLGWIFGVVLILLFSVAVELSGLNITSQSAVGLGMGLGMGTLQWFALRRSLRISFLWAMFLCTMLFLSYLLFDLLAMAYALKAEKTSLLATCVGAFLASVLQWRYMLRSHFRASGSWVLINTIAWTLSHVLTFGLFMLSATIKFHVPHLLSIILAFVFLLIGGPVLGYITGLYLRNLNSEVK